MRLFHDAVNFSELEDDLEDMEIYGEEEDSGNEGDTVIATFQPLRDDAFASFNVHKGIFIISIVHIYRILFIHFLSIYIVRLFICLSNIHLFVQPFIYLVVQPFLP